MAKIDGTLEEPGADPREDGRSPVKINSTVAALTITAAVAIGIGYAVYVAQGERVAAEPPRGTVEAASSDGTSPTPRWAASATGRIEPKRGAVRIGTQTPGKVEQVIVKTYDVVAGGDLLVRLDDDEAVERLRAADAEVQVRQRERNEEEAKGLALERRAAEDALASAERALFGARLAFDEVAAELRAGNGTIEDVSSARDRIRTAEERVATEKAALGKVLAKPNMPLPSRLESGLTQARAELSLTETAVERTRIRAPFEGTVLNVFAKEGEIAAPSPEAPLLLIGDLTTLRVRAEVEERDVTKVRPSQRVVVRADAFPDREFEGKVTSVAAALDSPRIASRGPRRPNDVEVLEVLAELEGSPPLLTGMRVDVFFKLDATAEAKPAAEAN